MAPNVSFSIGFDKEIKYIQRMAPNALFAIGFDEEIRVSPELPRVSPELARVSPELFKAYLLDMSSPWLTIHHFETDLIRKLDIFSICLRTLTFQ